MIRWLVALAIVAAAAAGALYYAAGRATPPALTIDKPERSIGKTGRLEITARAPGARFTVLSAAIEQNGRSIPLYAIDNPQSATTTTEGDVLRVTRDLGKSSVPELQQGAARLVVEATRLSFLGLRQVSSRTDKEIQVRLEPPRLAIASTHHYINQGGSETVLYRVTPADAVSGVRVGELEYPGYPASGAGVQADPSLRLAFFALLHDQDRATTIRLFARDDAGNEATAAFVDEIFPKKFKTSRITLDQRFLQRIVPDILAHSPELKASGDELLPGFLKINGDLRRANAERIAALTSKTSPAKLWNGPFVQLSRSQVEAGFADDRTYIYDGKPVDRQTHLGFDLAVTSAIPVLAANAGKVLSADWLGIYGNCVVLDHGMGVASLYGHLSELSVKAGDEVVKGQQLGRSGMTGLAAGDHLHFTMLVAGRPVNPVEWWDRHWIADRVERKLSAAGGSAPGAR
jgi:murein DD-endopeptidase MepM/ murein hydrolase activator NlpD